jgi:CheY-like chemotaxis protein
VDDDDAVRNVLARMVRAAGHTVFEAVNGLKALQALDTQPADLVITDVLMPDMEGLELLRRIRKRPNPPRVIAVSGGGRVSAGNYLQLAQHLGADAVLPKPVALDDLVRTIGEVMGPR